MPDNALAPGPAPEKKRLHHVKKFFKKLLMYLLVLIVLICVGVYLYVSHPVKDSASIDGTLVQFTVGDGFLFKTNEGLLNKGTSLTITSWSFSVRNDSLANRIKDLVGKKVTLQYTETVGSFFWQGKTNRFVTAVQVVN